MSQPEPKDRDQHGNPVALGHYDARATSRRTEAPAVTRETARFLLDLLARQQLSVGAPDFDQAVAVVVKAKAELLSIIEGRSDA